MKIITDKAAYIQKIDLEFFKYRLRTMPQSISAKIFENKEIDLDDYDKYDFLKFDSTEDIEFFKSIDWIIDYDSIKDLTTSELKEIGNAYVERLEKTAKKLYEMSEEDSDYKDTLFQYTLLYYQVASLGDISDFKLGLLQINMPTEKKTLKGLIRMLFTKKEK